MMVVKRGAVCNTDHRLFLMKLKIGKKFSRHGSNDRLVKRFDAGKLQGRCEDREGKELPKGKFVFAASDLMGQNWDQAMCSAARSEMGQAGRREADWFRESEDALRPLFEKKRQLFTQWLCSGMVRDKRKFVEARRVARRTVREVKNKWFQAKAADASAGRNGGKVVWKCIRDIQRSRRGLVPVRVAVMKNE